MVRDPAIEKMQAALIIWIENHNRKRGSVIRNYSERLYEYFEDPDYEQSNGAFQASECWSHRCLKQTKLYFFGKHCTTNCLFQNEKIHLWLWGTKRELHCCFVPIHQDNV